MRNIYENIEFIKNNINLIKNGSAAVDIVVVTKTFPCQDILEALKCGIKHIGESRMQEALPKFQQLGLSLSGINKHFIGHLQSNKAKKAVENFDLIQSLDSIKLAYDLNRHAKIIGKTQNCLIEVKVSQEITKTGVGLSNVKKFYKQCQMIPNILIKGLMVITPHCNFEDSRFYFKLVYNLFKDIKESFDAVGFDILSMGMSEDYKIAIEEGSNMIRIGSAIFGDRDRENK
ncbi:MAG: YggS family pyridoxal phosphate-dependent enzyme [Endomicrobium sp.]|jgi:pyridoxal phosphate enzyme (YggS family)|nr:YggS family pyridoxal phosphate-dependent enzyme [Endomicrobium sp.]